MNGDRDFVRSLSNFLALHTEQSAGYLNSLISSFMRGAPARSNIDRSEKDKIMSQMTADMEGIKDVPTFLQNYLHDYLSQDVWPPQAAFLASLYLRRRSGERFISWRQRQQFIAELDGELVRGTELGFRHLLYSQGAGAVFRWRGIPCFKTVYDVAIYAMLIDELRPGTIIELGSGSGGSALFLADLCTSAGLTTQIMSIDTAIAEVSDPRVAFIRSDCAAWLDATAKSKPDFPRPCLMIEDFHGDLPGFFGNIDAILEAGDYLFVEDSAAKQNRISQLIADRPYLIDAKYTDFFGINCTSALNSRFVKDAGSDNNTDTGAPSRAQQERQRLREQDRAWRQRNKRET
jgi:cephalosporin hydroxylase